MTRTVKTPTWDSVIRRTDLADAALKGFENCTLCPHACGVDRTAGQRGVCGAGDKLTIARSALHYWEEPPISGSAGSGTIFLTRCTLNCVYCQNFRISGRVSEVGCEVSVAELANECLALQKQGALNINLVTPAHYAPLLRECITQAREMGLELPIVWNTGGYESVETILANAGFVDIYLTDFKYASDELAKALSGVGDYTQRAIEALDAMVEQAGEPRFDTHGGEERMAGGVIVRHMMLPGHLRDSKDVLALLHERYGNRIKLSIMNQYTPVLAERRAKGDARAAKVLKDYPELAHPVDSNSYELLLDFADDLGIEDYYWQDGETALESFIPAFL